METARYKPTQPRKKENIYSIVVGLPTHIQPRPAPHCPLTMDRETIQRSSLIVCCSQTLGFGTCENGDEKKAKRKPIRWKADPCEVNA